MRYAESIRSGHLFRDSECRSGQYGQSAANSQVKGRLASKFVSPLTVPSDMPGRTKSSSLMTAAARCLVNIETCFTQRHWNIPAREEVAARPLTLFCGHCIGEMVFFEKKVRL
jgi:hypothetical protein